MGNTDAMRRVIATAVGRFSGPIFGVSGLVGCVAFWRFVRLVLSDPTPTGDGRGMFSGQSGWGFYVLLLGVLIPLAPMFCRDPAKLGRE